MDGGWMYPWKEGCRDGWMVDASRDGRIGGGCMHACTHSTEQGTQ